MNHERLLAWYTQNARDLPFRNRPDAYRVYISEVMAQQTRIEAMLGHYERFLALFPDLSSLAAASEDALMKAWQGLGYYSRARSLQKTAKICVEKYGARLPESRDELMKLPGIGAYTAGAIASIVYGERVSAVDGNVIRVYARYYGLEDDFSTQKNRKALTALVDADLPEGEAMHVWNQALMELGATVCMPKTAACFRCPLEEACAAARQPDPTRLPIKKEKKARRIEEKHIIVPAAVTGYGSQGKLRIVIALERRSKNGLLAGLYGFGEQKPAHVLYETDLGEYRHVFSHVEWNMKGALVLVDPAEIDARFLGLEEIEAGCSIPSAFYPFYSRAKTLLEQNASRFLSLCADADQKRLRSEDETAAETKNE